MQIYENRVFIQFVNTDNRIYVFADIVALILISCVISTIFSGLILLVPGVRLNTNIDSA
jgi:hypothetical protein